MSVLNSYVPINQKNSLFLAFLCIAATFWIKILSGVWDSPPPPEISLFPSLIFLLCSFSSILSSLRYAAYPGRWASPVKDPWLGPVKLRFSGVRASLEWHIWEMGRLFGFWLGLHFPIRSWPSRWGDGAWLRCGDSSYRSGELVFRSALPVRFVEWLQFLITDIPLVSRGVLPNLTNVVGASESPFTSKVCSACGFSGVCWSFMSALEESGVFGVFWSIKEISHELTIKQTKRSTIRDINLSMNSLWHRSTAKRARLEWFQSDLKSKSTPIYSTRS